MVCPALSRRASRLIETLSAWPVTTTWNASNSFFAAAIVAAAVAPAGGCALGRIFCAAGATQTWAADAEPAASKATNRGSEFTEPPWLAASRNGGGSSFRLANSGGLPLIARQVCCSMPKAGRFSGGRGLVSTCAYRAAPLLLRRAQRAYRAPIATCAGFVELQAVERFWPRGAGGGAGATPFASSTTRSVTARGSSPSPGAHCALPGDVSYRTLPASFTKRCRGSSERPGDA